jgi:uncharacterized protein YndB with AHSA1/START domain
MVTSESTYHLTHAPIAEAAMLIRRPVAEVFEAFVDPAITSRFWFSSGSGRLEPGARVHWDWEMYNLSVPVRVREFEPQRRILIEWGAEDAFTTVEWRFTARPDGTTFVRITNAGFRGDGDALASQASGSAGGFALVLAGLKALLEHNIALNLVADRFPDGMEAG